LIVCCRRFPIGLLDPRARSIGKLHRVNRGCAYGLAIFKRLDLSPAKSKAKGASGFRAISGDTPKGAALMKASELSVPIRDCVISHGEFATPAAVKLLANRVLEL
jgi:hypothetical protein